MRRLLSRALSRAAPLLAVLALAACADRVTGPGPDDGSLAQVRVTANVSGTPINTLVVTVTAPDISTPLVYNLTVQNGIATGTIKMPPGDGRTITVQAFDTGGQVTHTGSVTLPTVSPGQNSPVTLTLTSSAGHVPVTVTFGATSVLVSPASDSLAPGDSLQLTATLVNAFGDTLQGDVQWATTNPVRATVTSTGLVFAHDTGSVQIYATYEGMGGFAALTISNDTAPPPPPGGAFVWTGAVGSDWSVAGNWSGGVVPTAVDSALVPGGTANSPVLSAASSVGRIQVDSAATLSVGTFSLTVGTDVISHGSITGTGRVIMTGTGSVLGILPDLQVSGTVNVAGNVTTTAPLRILGGRLRNGGFRVRVNNL